MSSRKKIPVVKSLNQLYVAETKFGRGVFCQEEIKEDQVIEICPCVPLNRKSSKLVQESDLEDYVFAWPSPQQIKNKTVPYKYSLCCIVLGYGSLYNHSDNPNSVWKIDIAQKAFVFVALRDIPPYTEITHNYEWPDWKRKELGIQ